jgi:site-specific DNA recombinase
MLSNERYLGRVTWNQSKWMRVSGRKSRRRVQRPESEWVTKNHPELALVPKDLWDRVQARIRRTAPAGRGRPAASGRTVYLVSGLLRCGVCGGSMTVIGKKAKNGVSYARFGCTTHHSRGATVCSNGLGVSEKKASRALVDALKDKLDRPELIERFVSTFRQHANSLGKVNDRGEDADRRVRDGERRIANLTESLAKRGWSDALAAKLRDEEAQLTRVKVERTASIRGTARPVLPNAVAIAGHFRNLLAVLEADPARGRELLSRFVAPVVMTPEVDASVGAETAGKGPARRYRATSAFNLSFFVSPPEALVPREVEVKSSCAGRI